MRNLEKIVSTPEKIFIKTPEELTPKTAEKLLTQEILSDISAFPEEIRPLIEEHLISHMELAREEVGQYHQAVAEWWQNKYGFDFRITAARNEVLLRKYVPERLEEIHNLQAELFAAIKASEEKKITQLKEAYLANNPEQLESVEVLFGIHDFLLKVKKMDKERAKKKRSGKNWGEIRKKFSDLTEYQFLFTHFLLTHGEDREFLEEFWDAAEQIARQLNLSKELNGLRRGQMSQVATFKIMKKIGHKPALSHPDEDAFSAVDLWSDEDTAIQIKSSKLEQPALISVDEIYFPAIATETADAQNLYNPNQMRELQQKNRTFHAKIDKLGQRQHRKINGYMMVIPYNKIDFVNGEPDQEVVNFFREKIGDPDQPPQNG